MNYITDYDIDSDIYRLKIVYRLEKTVNFLGSWKNDGMKKKKAAEEERRRIVSKHVNSSGDGINGSGYGGDLGGGSSILLPFTFI